MKEQVNMGNNVRLTTQHRKMLKKGKIARMGLIESLVVRHCGKTDGKRGLPRVNEKGDWSSPFLRKEWAAFGEFCDRAWGSVQLELSDEYAKLGVLIDCIKRYEQELKALANKEPRAASEEELTKRHKGEEGLSDYQIRRRRGKSARNKMESYNAKVGNLQIGIKEAYEKMEKIHNQILEVNNANRMVCQRVKDHVEQRRSVYWNVAQKYHPEKDKMPVCPSALAEAEAELVYTVQHKSLEKETLEMMDRKERILTHINDLYSRSMIEEVA